MTHPRRVEPSADGEVVIGEPGPARLVETLISVIVFLGDRAYKIKKPVRLDYLDFSTLEARERMCKREVELNRRLAPDVYLGVADVNGPDGTPCEHLVVMRRMPDELRLSALVAAGAPLDGHLRDLARLLAIFHGRARRGPEIDAMARVDAVRARWEDNFATMGPFAGTVFDAADLERAERLAHNFVARRGPLFDQRVRAGHACDGHGDLQCADVFCLDDGPRVLDCIEFEDSLRYCDVAEDLAFLLMDLERLGAPALASKVRRYYEEFSGEVLPPALVHLYVAYRAQVRAKVAALRWGQEPAGESRTEARQLLRVCLAHLEAARVRLVIVGGLPGTGKSTLARGLAEEVGATVVRTDEIRETLTATGAGHGEEYREGAFAPAVTEAVYAAALDQAATSLQMGQSCVLDASWSDAGLRSEVRALGARAGAELTELRCVVDEVTAAGRIRTRAAGGKDPSRATPAVAEAMAGEFDPWPEARVVPTEASPDEVVRSTVEFLVRKPS